MRLDRSSLLADARPKEIGVGEWLAPPSSILAKLFAIAGLAGVHLVVFLVVYFSGGTSLGLPHLFYFPILLASTLFGVRGGLVAGLVSGLLMGPWMPLNVDTAQQQRVGTWVVRMACFVLVGGFAGLLMNSVRRHQAQLRWTAFHSPLTGLPNRAALLAAIADLQERTRGGLKEGSAQARADFGHTLLLVRVKNFDQIINALGAQVGDGLILALARRISDIVEGGLPVYDLGSQKVGILLKEGQGAIDAYLQRTRQMPEQPFLVDGIPIYADLILGAAKIDPEAASAEAIIQRANIALAEASGGPQHLVHYARQGEASRKKHVELLAYLPQAIDRRELFIEYQPKVDLRTGKTVGAEALLRWQHPVLGRIPPAEFIPLAEETSLIHPLTRLVFSRTADDYLYLRSSGLEGNIAVNLSPRNMSDLDMLEDLLRIYERHDIALDRIELEITESSILNASDRLLASIFSMRSRGMRVSIDDFGTGYTSLSYLADLPVDTIKIDQSFTRKILSDTRTCDIMQAIVDLSKKLGLSTVAEGIEDRPTANRLREMGCDTGQGYFFSHPVSRETLCRWSAGMPGLA